MAEKSKSKILKKLIIALVVALGVAAAGYFGLDLTEDDIVDFVSPIIENVVPAEEAPVVDDVSTNDVSTNDVSTNDVSTNDVPTDGTSAPAETSE